MDISEQRAAELRKYARAYEDPIYCMASHRAQDVRADLAALPTRGSLLDVACGRGEALDLASGLGFAPVQGTEATTALVDGGRVVWALATELPFADASFDVATLFDVIEHLIPGDDEAACRELARVARRHVLLTANNQPSNGLPGEELHINRRPYEEWDALFRQWFPGKVTRAPEPRAGISPGWRIDL